MKLIQAFRHHQSGGEVLATINGHPLGLPPLRPGEVRHSPGGFNFGYHSAGPAELARAILIALYPDDDLCRQPACYQALKIAKIAPVDGDLFELTDTEIDEWYAQWQATPPLDRPPSRPSAPTAR